MINICNYDSCKEFKLFGSDYCDKHALNNIENIDTIAMLERFGIDEELLLS